MENGAIKNEEKPLKKCIGMIGFGHLGQFLKVELGKSQQFVLKKIWNRTEDTNEGVLGLNELNAENLEGLDLVIEVAHPDIIRNHAKLILHHADLFIGSPTALANQQTLKEIQKSLKLHKNRSVFIPSGALWGAKDIQKMADLGTLKSLTVTMLKPPTAVHLPPLSTDSSPELSTLHKLCEESRATNRPKVLYDGPAGQICLLAPNNVNAMACAAIAAHNLGFANTCAKLIVDPMLQNWHIIECEIGGENGFRTTVRREYAAQPGGVSSGENTFLAFLDCVKETLYKPPGFNIC